jgi:hypothetical protein
MQSSLFAAEAGRAAIPKLSSATNKKNTFSLFRVGCVYLPKKMLKIVF